MTAYHRSPETKAKISAARKGQPAHNKGIKLTAEAKAKISASLKRLYATPKAQEDHRVVQRVLELFRPEVWAEKINGNRARLRARLRDPAFQVLAAAGRKAASERRLALKRSEQTWKAAIDARWQKIAAMHSSGMTKRDIARQIGVSYQRIGQILKKIDRRSPA